PAPAKDSADKPAPAPTLDDLLGLKKKEADKPGDSAAKEAARQNEEELARKLNDTQVGDVLERALSSMNESARLLDDQDPGMGTQRIQRDVLARLDELIDLAKSMSSQQQQQMSSSSAGKQQGRPQGSPGAQPRPAQGERRETGTNNTGQVMDPPPGRQGQLNTVLEQTESEWGNLP